MRTTLLGPAAILALALAASAPALAQETSPDAHLRQALQATRDHQADQALNALNAAEDEFLRSGASVNVQGGHDYPEIPVMVRQMGLARDALQQQNWDQAERDLTNAMAHTAGSNATNEVWSVEGSSDTGSAAAPAPAIGTSQQ
jgi:hypothetical protein